MKSNKNKMRSDFPPTSGHIPPTSSSPALLERLGTLWLTLKKVTMYLNLPASLMTLTLGIIMYSGSSTSKNN